jgi:hypothetical protein
MSLALSLLLAAATPDPFAYTAARTHAVAYQLATRNAERCETARGWWTGFAAESLAQYAPSVRAGVARESGIAAEPSITLIVPGSAAERAGLKAGDVIERVNGTALPTALPRKASYAPIQQLEGLLHTPKAQLVVRRGGERVDIALLPAAGCASRLTIKSSRSLNARADGTYLEVTTAAAAFAADPDELAFLIGHEMAHNILGHPALLDRIGRKASTIRPTEMEADRMALTLMKGAGYDPLAAARFWTRFGKATGFGILSDGTHMRTGPRIAFLRDEAAKLAAQ